MQHIALLPDRLEEFRINPCLQSRAVLFESGEASRKRHQEQPT
jgi:hypothetical protein